MKEKIKTILLIMCTIILIIAIVFITVVFMRNKQYTNKLSYDWDFYKNELVVNKKVVDSIEVSNMYIKINNNNKINMCYLENSKEICQEADYEYNDDILDISENNSYLNGKYKVVIDNNTMVLWNLNEGEEILIKLYFRKK